MEEQNYSNHRRLDPWYHFFIFPVLVLNLAASCGSLATGITAESIRDVLVAVALVMLFFKIRLYALRVQDRVIRLEERLRLSGLLSDVERDEVLSALSESQLVALRFASDEEAADLARRAARERLPNSEIKKAIKSWRADTLRV